MHVKRSENNNLEKWRIRSDCNTWENESETNAAWQSTKDLKMSHKQTVLQLWKHNLVTFGTHAWDWPAREHRAGGGTYAEADCEGFMEVDPQSPALCGNLGDAGRDESVSSSMSECEEGGLVDFFFPKACLNELLSWKKDRHYLSCLFALGELCIGALVCRCHPSHCLGSVCISRVLTVAARYL